MAAPVLTTLDQIRTEKLEATPPIAELVDRVAGGGTRLVVECDGKPVAAVVSVKDLARLEAWDTDRADAWEVLSAIGDKFADVTPEEIEREAHRAVQAVRARRRAEVAAVSSDE